MILVASILPVFFSTSTKTGVAPTCSITFDVAINDIGVVITSSPKPIPRAFRVTIAPLVQLLTPDVYLTPIRLENSSSNSFVLGPVVKKVDLITSDTEEISSVPKWCL